MELDLLLGVLKEGLKLWNSKDSTKYLDKVIKLEKEYYEELSNPSSDRSDFKLDSILLQLRILSQSFIQYPNKKSGSDGT